MKNWLFIDFTETVKNREPADVYNILADLEGWSGWCGLVMDTKWKGEPGWKGGNKFALKAGQKGVGLWMEASIFTVKENEEIGWGVEIPMLMRIFHNFTFRKVGSDVEVRTTEKFEGPLGLVFSLLLGRLIKKTDAEWLHDLVVRAR